SSTCASAIDRSVGVPEGSGNSDQRPSLPGGPWRRERKAGESRSRRERSGGPRKKLRSGASVSLVTSPAQTRDQIASSKSLGNAKVACCRSPKKVAPRF